MTLIEALRTGMMVQRAAWVESKWIVVDSVNGKIKNSLSDYWVATQEDIEATDWRQKGVSFRNALDKLFMGRAIRRRDWNYWFFGTGQVILTKDDMLAQDWLIQ